MRRHYVPSHMQSIHRRTSMGNTLLQGRRKMPSRSSNSSSHERSGKATKSKYKDDDDIEAMMNRFKKIFIELFAQKGTCKEEEKLPSKEIKCDNLPSLKESNIDEAQKRS